MNRPATLPGKAKLFVALTIAFALSACATGPRPFGGDPALSVVPGETLPPPTQADVDQRDRPYYIGPFDKLTIGVFGVDELRDREVQADASGRIAFPLAGVIEAGGKTPFEVAEIVASRLRGSYIREPLVTVNLKEAVNRVVTIDGQVNRPGVYPVLGKMSLVRAVATAGSTTEYARLEDVVVFRDVGRQKYAALYNLKAIRQGVYPDPEIYANDVLVVGDSSSRRLFKDLLQAAPLLVSPLVVLFQRRK